MAHRARNAVVPKAVEAELECCHARMRSNGPSGEVACHILAGSRERRRTRRTALAVEAAGNTAEGEGLADSHTAAAAVVDSHHTAVAAVVAEGAGAHIHHLDSPLQDNRTLQSITEEGNWC